MRHAWKVNKKIIFLQFHLFYYALIFFVENMYFQTNVWTEASDTYSHFRLNIIGILRTFNRILYIENSH